MKVVINKCFGGFSISEEAFKCLNLKWDGYGYIYNKTFNIDSDNHFQYRAYEPLVSVVEKLGEHANGVFAKLKIVEIPDHIEWYIDDYDGIENIHETHLSWS